MIAKRIAERKVMCFSRYILDQTNDHSVFGCADEGAEGGWKEQMAFIYQSREIAPTHISAGAVLETFQTF